ncbi:MAG: hypothetical protein ACRDAV_10995, partial [Plesiomonas shigelloides]
RSEIRLRSVSRHAGDLYKKTGLSPVFLCLFYILLAVLLSLSTCLAPSPALRFALAAGFGHNASLILHS